MNIIATYRGGVAPPVSNGYVNVYYMQNYRYGRFVNRPYDLRITSAQTASNGRSKPLPYGSPNYIYTDRSLFGGLRPTTLASPLTPLIPPNPRPSTGGRRAAPSIYDRREGQGGLRFGGWRDLSRRRGGETPKGDRVRWAICLRTRRGAVAAPASNGTLNLYSLHGFITGDS